MATANVPDPTIPGASRLRQAEGMLRENGVLVIPDDWNAKWVANALSHKLLCPVDIINQHRLEMTYNDVYPIEDVRPLLPGPVVVILRVANDE